MDAGHHARRLPRGERDVLPHRSRGRRDRRLGDVHHRRPAAGSGLAAGHLGTIRRVRRHALREGRTGRHRRPGASGMPATPPATCRTSPGTPCWRASSSASCWRARRPGPAPARPPRKSANYCTTATVQLFEQALTLMEPRMIDFDIPADLAALRDEIRAFVSEQDRALRDRSPPYSPRSRRRAARRAGGAGPRRGAADIPGAQAFWWPRAVAPRAGGVVRGGRVVDAGPGGAQLRRARRGQHVPAGQGRQHRADRTIPASGDRRTSSGRCSR